MAEAEGACGALAELSAGFDEQLVAQQPAGDAAFPAGGAAPAKRSHHKRKTLTAEPARAPVATAAALLAPTLKD